jgi:phospholipid/cholesterol/gamma-HCH transport system permease protein
MIKRFLGHVGRYSQMLSGSLTRPENKRMYWREFIGQCNDIGIRSLPIVLIVSAFLGMVFTVQTAYQLISPLVAKTTIASIVRDSTILELSPTVVCIVLAGVVGSKIASELGNMRVSEQIDALEIMGINTRAYLILPKIFASLLMIPLLIVLSIAVSILGGYAAGTLSGILTADQYEMGLIQGFKAYNVFFALVKAFVFAFIIATVPSYYGYFVKGGALEIGHASTNSVIITCILILFADYGLSVILL